MMISEWYYIYIFIDDKIHTLAHGQFLNNYILFIVLLILLFFSREEWSDLDFEADG